MSEAAAANGRDPRVLAIDAGGTMTDTFIVDRAGEFVVGKAQTTPEDESVGFMAAAEDVDGIVVNLLYSYRNSSHEDRIKELAAEIAPGLPVFLSSELYPIRR